MGNWDMQLCCTSPDPAPVKSPNLYFWDVRSSDPSLDKSLIPPAFFQRSSFATFIVFSVFFA